MQDNTWSRLLFENYTTLPTVLLDLIQDYVSIKISRLGCDNCGLVGTIYDVFDRTDELEIQSKCESYKHSVFDNIDTEYRDLHCRNCRVIYFTCKKCDNFSRSIGQMNYTMHGQDRIPMYDYSTSSLCRFDGKQIDEKDIECYKKYNPDAFVSYLPHDQSFDTNHTHLDVFFADPFLQGPLTGPNGGMCVTWTCLNCLTIFDCTDK